MDTQDTSGEVLPLKKPIGQRADFVSPEELQSGQYGRDARDGTWYARTPNGVLLSLSRHEVREGPDGTISVSPVLVAEGYLGWLEQGMWREEK